MAKKHLKALQKKKQWQNRLYLASLLASNIAMIIMLPTHGRRNCPLIERSILICLNALLRGLPQLRTV